jgi:hypothetical protein
VRTRSTGHMFLCMRMGFITCAAIAAVAAATASSVGGVSPADAAKRPQPAVSYLIEVTFNLVYENHWWSSSGERGDCEPWSEYDGRNEVVATNLGEEDRPQPLKPLRGQISIGGSAVIRGVRLPSSWARLNVVGDATGGVRRKWEQDGGPIASPCGGRPVDPFKPLPDDCRNVRTSTRAAVIRAEYRKNWSDLFNLTNTSGQGKPVVSVSVPLGNGAWKLPFATCKTTPGAPEAIANLGLPVRPKDIQALRTLRLGRKYLLHWSGKQKVFGSCDNESVNDARNGCEFEVSGWIAIRHVSTFG